MFFINIFVTVTSFPPSATGKLQQLQLEPKPEHDTTMAIITRRQQYSSETWISMDQVGKQHGHVGPATPAIDAQNSNTVMSNNIPIQLNPSIIWTCGQWREWKDSMVLAVVLTMFLVEDALKFLMMMDECCWYRNPSNQTPQRLQAKREITITQ